jgi:hypothetical protein
MPRFLTAIAALGLLTVINPAQSQGPTQPAAATASRINITIEQKHVIKEWIKDLKVEPAAPSVKLAVGEVVPPDVVLQAIPTEIGQKVPQIKTHQFVLVADQIAIVDPKDHKVVDLIRIEG